MMMLPPKTIEKKVTIRNKEVVVREGETLTPEEKVIFDTYKKDFKEAFKNRFN